MAFRRLSMRKLKEIFRLCWGLGISVRQAAQSCGVGRTTVRDYLDRARKAGLHWPLPEELDETALENLLFPSTVPLSLARTSMISLFDSFLPFVLADNIFPTASFLRISSSSLLRALFANLLRFPVGTSASKSLQISSSIIKLSFFKALPILLPPHIPYLFYLLSILILFT